MIFSQALTLLVSLVYRLVLFLVFTFYFGQVEAIEDAEIAKENVTGAYLYRQYCVLCHGISGLGEGVLPMVISSYPNTNLLESRFGKDKGVIRKMINHCESNQSVETECVPFVDEFNEREVTELTNFVMKLRLDNAVASEEVISAANEIKPSLTKGKALYHVRCSACHGVGGKGDGRIARVLQLPPADFTKSKVSDQYIIDIVTKGGEAMGRSSSMPVFEGNVDNAQIKSIILFLKTLRASNN